MSKTQRCSRALVLALASVAIVVCGTAAEADPIRFDNPAGEGHFVWYGGTWENRIGLDVTLPAADQTPTWDAGQYGQGLEVGGDRSSVSGSSYLFDLQHCIPTMWLVGVDFLEPIPSGDEYGWYHNNCFILYGDGTDLPEGEPIYVGVQFPIQEDEFHYGWIGGVRTGHDFDTFAWGYETEPGVPILAGIPEPATLALLAFGGLALLRHRR